MNIFKVFNNLIKYFKNTTLMENLFFILLLIFIKNTNYVFLLGK